MPDHAQWPRQSSQRRGVTHASSTGNLPKPRQPLPRNAVAAKNPESPLLPSVKPLMALPKRSQIRPGLRVQIVEKQNQRTGALTEGVVLRILTKSPSHPHGIKVMLEDGRVGRVQAIMDPARNDRGDEAGIGHTSVL